MVQLGLFGAAFVGFTIIAELRNGVVERMRVTPASRLALLMGRVLRDVVTLLVQSLVLVAVGVAFGLAPSWLNAISHANPFRYVVDGMRDAFIGHYTTTAMWTGLGVAIAVAAIAVLIGTRTFRAENA